MKTLLTSFGTYETRTLCGVEARVLVDAWSELIALDTPSEEKAAEVVAHLVSEGWYAEVDKDHPKSLDAFRAINIKKGA